MCTHVTDLAALGRLDHLSDRTFRVLYVMASVARDEGPRVAEPNLYFGGWEYLAKTIGYRDYTPAAQRAVARAIAELVAAGLIKRVGNPGPMHRQAYLITLPDRYADPSAPDQ